jgi:SAM-dependent methyltransferase
MGDIYKRFFWKPRNDKRPLTRLEEIIYNDGERLIPGVTHDLQEVVRHRSSYEFFRLVIENDLTIVEEFQGSRPVKIIDFGCGVGHGCYVLSGIRNSRVRGVDFSKESLEYAKCHYGGDSITYTLADLNEFVIEMPETDYVVSRGVLEHIQNGIQLAMSTKWRYRLLFDVPYDEPEEVNPHHLLTGIREENFSEFPNAELFFQDLSGIIYDVHHKPPKPNMVICVSSHPSLPKVGSTTMDFPLPAWEPDRALYV